MFDIKINDCKDYIVKKARKFIEDGFFDCVNFTYTCNIIDESRVVEYDFYLKNSIANFPFIIFKVDEEDNIIVTNCLYCNDNPSCSHCYACYLLYENYKKTEQYVFDKKNQIKLLDELEKNMKKEIYEKKRLKALDNVKGILDTLKSQDVLIPMNKYEIELDLFVDLDYSGAQFCNIDLKVGDDKKYVIKSISNFLKSIDNNEYVSYGKKFGFVHALKSFDSFSQDLILFLNSLMTIETVNTRVIKLNKSKTDFMFNLFKDHFINIEYANYSKNNYMVTLNKTNISLLLDDHYILKIKNSNPIIIGYNYDYILEDNEVKVVDYDDTGLRVLVQFLAINNYQSYETIQDVFCEQIYPRLNRYIEVPEEIKKKLSLVEYSIRAYFDYQSNGLVCETKYFCNDIEIKKDDMNSVSFKLTKYQNFLDNLGFNNLGVITDMQRITNFLRMDLSDLKSICDIYLSENIKKMQVKTISKISTHMSYAIGMLDICFEASDFSNEELNKIIKSLRKKIKYVKLNNNTIIEIDDDTSDKLLNMVDEFNLDSTKLTIPQQVPLYQALKLNDKDINFCDYLITDDLRSLINDIVNYKNADFVIPDYLQEVMRSYQKEAFLWMKTLIKYGFCGILADDMGLGKTLEVISVLCSDVIEEPILIVCPKSLCYNWKNEFDLWGNDSKVENIIGSSVERIELIKQIKNDEKVAYITSYDSLRNDIKYYQDKKFRYLILDEAQSIKNHETMKAKSVKLINSKYRFVLTGTPIENTIVDLWSIFDFLMPGYFSNYTNFKSKYEKSIVDKKDDEVVYKLVKKISPFVLRRTKKEVLKDLPEKIEFIRMTSMDSLQQKVYDAQLLQTRKILESKNNDKILLLSCINRLRQICVDPSMYLDNYEGGSCKIDLVMELLDEYIKEGHKVIIFSQFVKVFERLSELLTENGYKYYILTGKTSAEDRVNMATEFNKEDNDVKVFLVSLKAGGTGLNLIGADVVIHLDPWWNYAVENQATDRTHRIGQKKNVSVIKVVVEKSIEQKVIELQRLKKELSEKIIASDDSNIERLVTDDIKFLLE